MLRHYRQSGRHYIFRMEADGYSMTHSPRASLTTYEKGDREWLMSNTKPTTPLYALLRAGDSV